MHAEGKKKDVAGEGLKRGVPIGNGQTERSEGGARSGMAESIGLSFGFVGGMEP